MLARTGACREQLSVNQDVDVAGSEAGCDSDTASAGVGNTRLGWIVEAVGGD